MVVPVGLKAPVIGGSQEIVQAAWFDRTDLSAHGFHKTPDVTGWNGQKWQNHPFHYFTYGAAVSEVELDTLTGRTAPCLAHVPGSNPGLPPLLKDVFSLLRTKEVSHRKTPKVLKAVPLLLGEGGPSLCCI